MPARKPTPTPCALGENTDPPLDDEPETAEEAERANREDSQWRAWMGED